MTRENVRRWCVVAVVLLGGGVPASGTGAIPTKVIRAGKLATALLEADVAAGRRSRLRGYASAFCVHRSGLFITNAHAVGERMVSDTLSLVILPGTPREKVVQAKVIRKDPIADLALLRAPVSPGQTVLSLGDSGGLIETMDVVSFGYPFGAVLRERGKRYPTVTVNTGQISSLRKERGKLKYMQLSALLNPGCSGGPVLDADGKVIGVVKEGVRGSSVAAAVPISSLREFLSMPQVVFSPPQVSHADRYKPLRFRADVVSLVGARPKVSLQLELSGGSTGRRTVALVRRREGTYTASIAPLERRGGKYGLSLEASYANGQVRCVAADCPVKIGSSSLGLGQLETLEPGAEAVGFTDDGRRLAGALDGVSKVQGSLGGSTVVLDLSCADRVRIRKITDPTAVSWRLLARLDGRDVWSEQGTLHIAPPLAGTGEWTEVLPKVDLKRDVRAGKWRRKGNSLYVDPDHRQAISLPARPYGSYRVRVKLRVRDINSRMRRNSYVVIALPVGPVGAGIALNVGRPGEPGGLMGLDKSLVVPTDARMSGLATLADEQEHEVEVSVMTGEDQAQILVRIDDQERLTWSGPVSKLCLSIRELSLRSGHMIALAGRDADVEIRRVSVRPLSGGDVVVRGTLKMGAGYEISPYLTGLRGLRAIAVSPGGTFGHKGSVFLCAAGGKQQYIYRASEKGRKVVFCDAPNGLAELAFAPAGLTHGPYLYGRLSEELWKCDLAKHGDHLRVAKLRRLTRLAFGRGKAPLSELFVAGMASARNPFGAGSTGPVILKVSPQGAVRQAMNLSDVTVMGLAVGPGGEFGDAVYVSHSGGGARKPGILKVTRQGGTTPFAMGAGLGRPAKMVFDSVGKFGGKLLVCDAGTGEVVAIDPDGKAKMLVRGLGLYRLSEHYLEGDLDVGPDGSLYVCDPVEGIIWRLVAKGTGRPALAVGGVRDRRTVPWR